MMDVLMGVWFIAMVLMTFPIALADGAEFGGLRWALSIALISSSIAFGIVSRDRIRDDDLVDRGVLEYRHDGPDDSTAELYWTVPRKAQP